MGCHLFERMIQEKKGLKILEQPKLIIIKNILTFTMKWKIVKTGWELTVKMVDLLHFIAEIVEDISWYYHNEYLTQRHRSLSTKQTMHLPHQWSSIKLFRSIRKHGTKKMNRYENSYKAIRQEQNVYNKLKWKKQCLKIGTYIFGNFLRLQLLYKYLSNMWIYVC